MTQSSDKIAALIGSRICHDLINPIGAVANGLELLELSGALKSPEMWLVVESAGSASARIRFLRLAFGDSSDGQMIDAAEAGAILDTVYTDSRTAVRWLVTGTVPRAEVKMALFALLCAEEALVSGGKITVTRANGRWRVVAEAARLSPDAALWSILSGNGACDVSPTAVQFALLPEVSGRNNRKIGVQHSENTVEIKF